jgi:hypothetical protein
MLGQLGYFGDHLLLLKGKRISLWESSLVKSLKFQTVNDQLRGFVDQCRIVIGWIVYVHHVCPMTMAGNVKKFKFEKSSDF